jgi:shikimate kinase
VLVGFMGAGKSTVGRLLAHRIGWPFIDLDREIERLAGKPIAALFATLGEPGFRLLEQQATAALAPLRATVLATGGGWVLDPQAHRRLGVSVTRVWLRVSLDEALRRLDDEPVKRPLLAGPDPRAAAAALLHQRESLYAMAEHVIDVDDCSVETIVRRISTLTRTG